MAMPAVPFQPQDQARHFEQCYNAQVAVDTDTQLVVAQGLTQAGNDKRQVVPMLAEFKALPASLGRVTAVLGDCGYNSESNITACGVAEIEPYLAVAREDHHPVTNLVK